MGMGNQRCINEYISAMRDALIFLAMPVFAIDAAGTSVTCSRYLHVFSGDMPGGDVVQWILCALEGALPGCSGWSANEWTSRHDACVGRAVSADVFSNETMESSYCGYLWRRLRDFKNLPYPYPVGWVYLNETETAINVTENSFDDLLRAMNDASELDTYPFDRVNEKASFRDFPHEYAIGYAMTSIMDDMFNMDNMYCMTHDDYPYSRQDNLEWTPTELVRNPDLNQTMRAIHDATWQRRGGPRSFVQRITGANSAAMSHDDILSPEWIRRLGHCFDVSSRWARGHGGSIVQRRSRKSRSTFPWTSVG